MKVKEIEEFGFEKVGKEIRIGKHTITVNGIATISIKPDGKPSQFYHLPKYGIVREIDKKLNIIDCVTLNSLVERLKEDSAAINYVICDSKLFIKRKK
ncbi:MAG: hypothetical protein QMD14_01205 [Candidatus Aenigmarchaeota archaeon]|nr:hypothetical protein [Candidatus Aenigmarchaeota archaeon]